MTLTREQVEMARSAHPHLGGAVWKDGTYFINFNLDLTLRCDGGCPDCMKLLGVLPHQSHESDVTEEHLAMAAEAFRRHNIRIRRLRITGGEPLLHPDFYGIFEKIKRIWEPVVIRLFTNGLHPLPWKGRHVGSITRPIYMEEKKGRHVPFYVSPADLGIAPRHGFMSSCCIINGCGRSMDAYGFSPCLQYPGLGRVLGLDLHYGYPKLLGEADVCKHCICSLDRPTQKRIRFDIASGRIEYPTKTFHEGIEREKSSPVKFASFRSRVEDLI